MKSSKRLLAINKTSEWTLAVNGKPSKRMTNTKRGVLYKRGVFCTRARGALYERERGVFYNRKRIDNDPTKEAQLMLAIRRKPS